MDNTFKMPSDDELKKRLSADEYRVLRERGTEMPFTGKFYNSHEQGMYTCKVCGNELFSSDTKFDSGTGWPSFTDVSRSGGVTLHSDSGHGMERTEVRCARCGSHLGHVFDDGPGETGKRYCINSVCLDLKKDA